MKTIGLIGGMSWESTVSYYQLINQAVKNQLGGLHSAKILLYSVDFAEIEAYQYQGQWEKAGQVLAEIAQKLEQAGADLVLICTNTMHKVAPQVQEMITVPLLHIARATADALVADKIKKVGLLGTKYTMTQDFYKQELFEAGLQVLVPDEDDMDAVNRIIFEELCLGQIKPASKTTYLDIIAKLQEAGAEAVILGCTEIGLLVQEQDTSLPLYDTTMTIHTRAKQYLQHLVTRTSKMKKQSLWFCLGNMLP